MHYCVNPHCQVPENVGSGAESCQSCGALLALNGCYQALKQIGQGGFGRTFLAVNLVLPLKPRCVVKQLYSTQQSPGTQDKAALLFAQEAQQLSRLGHYPSMPKFLDYFEQDGYQYLVQEFIEGESLAEILQQGRLLSADEIEVLLETMLETLDFLHHAQIIHRDVKPANIIQTINGRFVLVDLGAAKLATGTAFGLTGTVIGSAEFVAPEQLRGKAVFASDLYSLGATCVMMLTGISPFDLFDTTIGNWAWRDYLKQPVSERLGKISDRMLVAPTRQRYQSAAEVLQDLAGQMNWSPLDKSDWEISKNRADWEISNPKKIQIHHTIQELQQQPIKTLEAQPSSIDINTEHPGKMVKNSRNRPFGSLSKELRGLLSLFALGVIGLTVLGLTSQLQGSKEEPLDLSPMQPQTKAGELINPTPVSPPPSPITEPILINSVVGANGHLYKVFHVNSELNCYFSGLSVPKT
jgi:serine/threonine protein kinase